MPFFLKVNRKRHMQAQLAKKVTGATKANSSAFQGKWCGWCLKRTEQKLVESRTLRATTYECSGCQGSTVTCSTSDCEGMSRRWILGVAGEDAIDYHESTCLNCQGNFLML